jgi:adenosylcobinamide-phosphate synthase
MTATNFILALGALAIEALAGYPGFLYRVIGHPVTWIGGLIATLDRVLNREKDWFARRRARGTWALVMLLAICAAIVGLLELTLRASELGFIVLVPLAASLPAQRSLHIHVRAVIDALKFDGLDAGRGAVAMIVGRNTEVLDEAAVCRAAIESLAENFSDGVVAPAFWICLGGLTGGVLYKAVNTADSMIGHRTPRHQAFGWAAARLDDLVNLPASRLAALWIVIAALIVPGADAWRAARAIWRDARRHRSPNAGWPEAAMAGALGLSLAGPRFYGDTYVEDALMGDGRREATTADIRRALRLFRFACGIQWACIAFAALVLIVQG